MNGIAPGNAPTNTESGVIGLRGVYKHVYMKIDMAPKRAVLGFIL
jgi:hypothetical protein